MPNRPKHLAAGDSSAYLFGEHLFRFLATGEEPGGSYSSMEIVSPQDTGPGPHTDDEAEEHFLLLEGTVDFRVDGDLFSVEPGGFVHVPRGAVHEFKVTTPQAKMVAPPTAQPEMSGRSWRCPRRNRTTTAEHVE